MIDQIILSNAYASRNLPNSNLNTIKLEENNFGYKKKQKCFVMYMRAKQIFEKRL